MRTLTSAERRALRAQAHHLDPVVSIGANGLTPSVLREIDVNLAAHELVKVRVFEGDRDERERLFALLCADLDAAPVQHLGKILMLWRPSPPPEAAPIAARSKAAAAAAKRRSADAARSRPRASADDGRRRRAAGNSRRRQA
jgi:putative YhbY family RNA-binding protein